MAKFRRDLTHAPVLSNRAYQKRIGQNSHAGVSPPHRYNTTPWEYFSGMLKHLSCLAPKAIVAK
ncbi:hypothetical protein [Microcoleus sp. OTE_8_concoct_300]|uniref:hypothetical protein n=1 Tax=Microcoleus sp. OTE_8_concoct_300 TaxID=2964710 RepID=UPI00403F0537